VRDQIGGDGSGDLAAVLRAALSALPDDPRTSKARRAVDRTYFHGPVTQEAAAEVLGMAFSTYRRHLQAGSSLLADQLWRWELFGP
jgi:DNA-directed RNA polymerase specialized sigma24 family protein